ncbi:MAG: hypothetical protein JXR37_18030, partial [Kiritimatiellae bacterium]|nr:hypothetical protein [Kiritimatiellia bacterium]
VAAAPARPHSGQSGRTFSSALRRGASGNPSGTTLLKILGAVAAPRIFLESGGGTPRGAWLAHAGVHDGVSTSLYPAPRNAPGALLT